MTTSAASTVLLSCEVLVRSVTTLQQGGGPGSAQDGPSDAPREPRCLQLLMARPGSFSVVLKRRGLWSDSAEQQLCSGGIASQDMCHILACHILACEEEAVQLQWDLSEVLHMVLRPTVHELHIFGDHPEGFSIYFEEEEMAKQWTTLINSSYYEIQRATEQSEPGMAATQDLAESLVQAELLSVQLGRAIHAGDVAMAQHLASRLTDCRSPVLVQLKPRGQSSSSFRIKVQVENKRRSVGPIYVKVSSQMTVAALKQQIFRQYGLHPKVQRWVINQRLATDDNTLHHYRVQREGDKAFLYLVSAQQADLKKEEFERAQIGLFEITGGLGEGAPIVKTESANPVFSPNWPAPASIRCAAPLISPAAPLIPAAATHKRPASPPPVGWPCPVCTFVNLPLRPGCDLCGTARPADYQVPAGYRPTDRERRITDQELNNRRKLEETLTRRQQENFLRLLQEDEQQLVPNKEAFTCSICFVDYEPGEGVTLRECLHNFCKDCLQGTILNCEDAEVTCPNQEDGISCEFKLHQREIKALVSEEDYCRFLGKGLAIAENRSADSYHCVTADCQGWCFYEDMVNDFLCPVCNKSNCLTCKAIHEGMNCQQYQDDLKLRADNDEAAMQTNHMLQTMVQTGEAMHCPMCKVIVQKKDGCDWICCSICKTEICWVTKGARWGPQGHGDTSGGCRCRVNDRMCHPDCMNCH